MGFRRPEMPSALCEIPRIVSTEQRFLYHFSQRAMRLRLAYDQTDL